MDTQNRNKIIVRTSLIGILANFLLAGGKAVVGLLANSISVVLDAVNNLSDALSSVITIIGAKLSLLKPNKKHPLGYGRIEYLSATIVAGIVLYAGITAMVESIKGIINPSPANYSTLSLVIISVAVAVKIVLGLYVQAQGKKAKSDALIASGKDALFDAILSFSVLLSAIIYMIWGVSLEAYVGVGISIFIIKAGIEMMIGTLNDILGKREDGEISKKVKSLIAEEDDVRGAYDLVLFDYGPNKKYGSVHIELPDTMSVAEVDVLTRKIEAKVYRETGIILTGIGVYSFNTSDNEVAKIREEIQKILSAFPWAIEMHGFYLDTKEKTVRFDVVIDFKIQPKEAIEKIRTAVSDLIPDYKLMIIPDVDVSTSE